MNVKEFEDIAKDIRKQILDSFVVPCWIIAPARGGERERSVNNGEDWLLS